MSNCDDETLNAINLNKPTKTLFSDEAGQLTRQLNQTQEADNSIANATPPIPALHPNALNIFLKTMLAILTSKDAVQKEVRDCNITQREEHCKQITPYIPNVQRDMHVKWQCFCVDDRIAFPNYT